VSALPFDRIVILSDSGKPREMSVDEFLALPLDQKIKSVLSRRIEFYDGHAAVDRKLGLASLRTLQAAGKPPRLA
jgi:hypothetical protein